MKKNILILLIFIPLLSFGQTKRALKKALKTVNLNERIELLNQIISAEPNNLDAYFYRAVSKNDLGDYSGAIVDYSKIIIEEPGADTYFNRGNSKYSNKDLVGAKEDYAKAFMLDSNFIDALYSLACVKFDLGENKEAITDFTAVIKRVPNSDDTYSLRALAYRGLKQNEKALEDYSLAININPNGNNFYNRGAFLTDIGYYKEAYSDLTMALKLNKNNAFAYFYRGTSNLFLGQFNDAISDFKAAIKFDSIDFDAYLGLAMAYNKTNNNTEAKINFDRANAIIIPDKNLNSIEQYANTYWFQNKYYYFNNAINKIKNN